MLSYLNLRNNLMGQVPFVSLGHVGSLKYLDLSNNRIAKIEDPFFQVRKLNFLKKQRDDQMTPISPLQGRLRLDTLLLRENDIAVLTPGAFLNFEYINHTSLAGNPIRALQSGAFADTRIRVLDLSNCFISALSPEVLKRLTMI